MTMRQVAVYVFRIRTNVVLVVASVIGYYFFSGVRTFAVVFSRQQYGLGQAQAALLFPVLGVGAVIGVLVSGRCSDRLAARGYRSAHIVAVLVAYFGAVAFLAPALLAGSLAVGLPLLVAAAGLLGAVNPPLDAARIDIMPTALLGRAESVRSLLRNVGDATAPVVFGVLGAHIGLQRTFLVMLLPMLLGGLLGLLALRSFPADVAAAQANDRRMVAR